MPTVYLAYGSNMGDRQKNINAAVKLLNQAKITVTKISRAIETQPIGGIPQASYLNGALEAQTRLSPTQLLKQTKRIEHTIGRIHGLKNGPRPIDLDILLYGNLKIKNKGLQIPHPEIKKRKFVLNPLKEIAPNLNNNFL
ncbi:MAG: 2-amino-4-hydroxy-6-hydroxymethyldihydropteridine diphosphokinase [Candidatus Omnitrophica bacterium]|nr:2-amino-4-hydroxy-6-hydroxymethyldihydropteridine diphosphokinase [Candidatus Omnitrophota bacterium]